ncbi:hypothetical protein PPL_03142 [Heterostelium album PN500]|uniref:ABC3 transporter permease C-terminal domain-containing protein n=1 Tax=Heterostelium pallidum (strain ATCC 26659 / Pp 5 / PN500) TaxID=670386 RepID=D3B421_HETP5|nr:hypothetical protein PPL_03142 [Heterostelium album PN500]EFA84069.1 hypothetical protein PPL_03142 [Heterostelium album PN500]|eukprot:XP_020436186.1 hypothetical protein PPL_03142 [Heterostelium album PN500]
MRIDRFSHHYCVYKSIKSSSSSGGNDYKQHVELSRLNYLSDDNSDMMDWNEHNGGSGANTTTTTTNLGNSNNNNNNNNNNGRRKKKNKKIRNNAIITDNDVDSYDDDDDDSYEYDNDNKSGGNDSSNNSSTNSSIDLNNNNSNVNLRKSSANNSNNIHPTRYQKLGEVDSSLLYDSDNEDDYSRGRNSSSGRTNNPFRQQTKRQSSKYNSNGYGVSHNLETISGFFIYIYHTLRYTIVADLQVAIRYVHKNSKKNLKSILMGLLTVFLVVMFISFLQNLIQASPIVFLKLSEDQAGEWDLLITGDPSLGSAVANNNTLSGTAADGVHTTSSKRSASFNIAADSSSFDSDSSSSKIPHPNLDHIIESPLLIHHLNNNNNNNNNLQANSSGVNPLSMLSGVSGLFLNSTVLTKKLATASMVHGVAPRWLSLASVMTKSTNISASLIMLVMNSTLEKDMGLGRGWDHPPLKDNQAHISSSYLRRIGVEPNKNQSVNLHVDFVDVLQRLGSDSIPSLDQVMAMVSNYLGIPIPGRLDITFEMILLKMRYPNIVQELKDVLGDGISSDGNFLYPPLIIQNFYNDFRQELVIDQTLVVMDGIDSPGGKYPSSLGNVAVLESSYIDKVVKSKLQSMNSKFFGNISTIETLLKAIIPLYNPKLNVTDILTQIDSFRYTFGNFTNNFNLNEYSMASIVMLENRVKIYTSEDPKNSLIAFTNQVAMHIGYSYPALFTTPLAAALGVFQYTRLSLDQVFNCVAAVLLVLGALMIYSLLLSDVEGKTFEYGMLRAQGMRHYALIILLLTQALYFSVPGIAFGLFFGWVCFAIVAHFVYQFVMLPVDLTFYTIAILSGGLMGLCLPILANIAPIQRALSRTLRDALDVYHQVKNETMVKIMKLEEIGFDPLQTALSILAVVVGFTVYYLIPLSFTFMNYSLFFAILTGILLGMLFGLAMLAQAVQSHLEKLICFLMIWGPDRRTLYNLVRKNLASHSGRNAKTATMFTICLTFIIFTGCVFRLQGYNIQELVKLGVGSDIDVVTTNTKFPLPETDLRGFLDNEIFNNSATTAVESYSFVTLPLDHVMNIRSTYMNTLAGYPWTYVKVYGIDENYLASTYINFLDVTQTNQRLSFSTVPGSTSQSAREYVVNSCKNFIKSDSINVIDTAFLLDSTDTAITLLNIFFYTVSATSIILCFFMLWVSFASNIHENSWEFGVLRAIGLTTNQVIRIYIYEALVLIFSSVILGLIIGLGVAVTLTLQLNLFTQLPFSFQFPFGLFFGVFGASIVMAVLVSRQASKEYSSKQIASVLKGK